LLGSGVILNEALRAQQILADKYKVASTVYSVTSYTELRRDAIACERHNRLHPTAEGRLPYVQTVLGGTKGPIVATSDYMRALAEWSPVPRRPAAGPRDRRVRPERDPAKALRRFFEVDAENVAVAALYALAERASWTAGRRPGGQGPRGEPGRPGPVDGVTR
jgi:pyruvate dehydrogenase E1 component